MGSKDGRLSWQEGELQREAELAVRKLCILPERPRRVTKDFKHGKDRAKLELLFKHNGWTGSGYKQNQGHELAGCYHSSSMRWMMRVRTRGVKKGESPARAEGQVMCRT